MTVHDMLEHMSRAREQSGFWRSLLLSDDQTSAGRGGADFRGFEFHATKSRNSLTSLPSRIEVVYNAIDERFLHGHASDGDRELIARRYQVTYPFLLYAGSISPHKNVVRMIEAFSALKTNWKESRPIPT